MHNARPTPPVRVEGRTSEQARYEARLVNLELEQWRAEMRRLYGLTDEKAVKP